MILFRVIRTLFLLALAVCAGLAAPLHAEPIPAAAFFANASFNNVALSPDGKTLSIQMARKDGRILLATMDVETMTPRVVANFQGTDVEQVHWISNERLVFSLGDSEAGQGDVRLAPGLFAVNRDGSRFRQLADRNFTGVSEHRARDLLPWNTFFFRATAKRDSDEIFVIQPQYDNRRNVDRVELLRLDTGSGRVRPVRRPGASHSWLIDQNDVPRVTVTFENGRESIWYREGPDADWRKVTEYSPFDPHTIRPLYAGSDNTFYVRATNGKDKAALYKYDPAGGKLLGEPILSLPDNDFNGNLLTDADRLLGIRYETDAVATAWLDERMKQVQKDVDALLPATTNLLEGGARSDVQNFVVRAYSDVQPAMFYLYNAESRKLTLIGKSHADIDPKRMSPKDPVRYAARDGLSIPAYLTLPKDGAKKNLPLVVLVHGGPWVRGGHWRWEADVQFLASRGYAVLQPDFRGSTGYGFKHFKAGWKQWGNAMQDDIADAAKWAVAKGIADPNRICLAGASYGGYATLMGLIRNPELFRCGVEWLGVSDLDMMYSVNWSDTSEDAQRYGMPVLIGDREKDAALLKAASPLQNAAKLKRPVLMAYGGADRRVPIVHGTAMRDALKAAGNQDVEWVVYPEEGHGWTLVPNRIDFWQRVEAFLGRHIGKDPG